MPDTLSFDSPDGNCTLQVDLTHGGRIMSLRIGGSEVLVDRTDDPLTWGCYPMVPFAGRIRNGALSFDGSTYALPHTLGPHAMHGYGFTSAWTQLDDAAIRLDFSEPWPFGGAATQRFVLEDERLVVHMTIDADERQPINIGWHPWFRRNIDGLGDLDLTFEPGLMYERDSTGIPTGRTLVPSDGPWDDCFTGMRSNPVLRWGTLALTLSSTADHWVVYDEPSHAVCVEPQTGPPNDANDRPRVIESGESLTVSFTLEW